MRAPVPNRQIFGLELGRSRSTIRASLPVSLILAEPFYISKPSFLHRTNDWSLCHTGLRAPSGIQRTVGSISVSLSSSKHKFADEYAQQVERYSMSTMKEYPLEEALKAQKSLRAAAGLGAEQFPIQAFVGMISDEIESLRKAGKTDDQIAAIIRDNSAIEISAEEIAENYASPEERHFHG